MKIFGGDMITNVYNTLGADENIPIEAKMISNAVERAQKRVEGRNFSIRKNVLQYDDVMNVQREIIYKQRKEVLDGQNLKENITSMLNSTAEEVVNLYLADGEHVNNEGLVQEVKNIFDVDISEDIKNKHKDDIIAKIKEEAGKIYQKKEEEIGEQAIRELERVVMLKVVDQKWMDHIDSMDELKNGIGLRAYGQKNPVDQYRIEGFDMFDEMIANIKVDVVKLMLHMERKGEVERTQTAEITKAAQVNLNNINFESSEAPKAEESTQNTTVVNNEPKVGRNDLCPCRKWEKV